MTYKKGDEIYMNYIPELSIKDYTELYANSFGIGIDPIGFMADHSSENPKTIAGKCDKQIKELEENAFKSIPDKGYSTITAGFSLGLFVNAITFFVPALVLFGYNVLRNIKKSETKKSEKEKLSIDDFILFNNN